jgi:hypothetical protein
MPLSRSENDVPSCVRYLAKVLVTADAIVVDGDSDHPAIDELLHGAFIDHRAEPRGALADIQPVELLDAIFRATQDPLPIA